MKILTPLVLIALAVVVSAQQPAAQSSETVEQRAFNNVEVTGEGTRSFFIFVNEGFHYIIRADGHSESDSGKGRPRNFDLKVGGRGHVERVYFTEHEGDLLLIYEVSDKQYGWGYVLRFDQKTLKPKWTRPINGYNLGPGLIEAGYAYLSATNLLAKIDLRSGEYAWQATEFQKQYAQSSTFFRLPTLSGDRVLFREDAENGKTVELDKTTGKILNVRN